MDDTVGEHQAEVEQVQNLIDQCAEDRMVFVFGIRECWDFGRRVHLSFRLGGNAWGWPALLCGKASCSVPLGLSRLKRTDTVQVLTLRQGRVLGAGASVLPIVAHQSAQLAQGEPSFLVNADEQRWRYGKSTLSDFANLGWSNIEPCCKLSVVSGAQQAHEGIEQHFGIIVRIVPLHYLRSEFVYLSSCSEWSCSHGALAPRCTVSS